MHLQPSGFIGAAMAVQGIKDATVVLHGQNGCRKGLLSSQTLMTRTDEKDGRFYNSDNAIPYSNVRPEDYYQNTLKKLEDVMEHVDSEDYSLKVIMVSPGISLIGDDCKRISLKDKATMVLNTDNLPKDAPSGFDQCLCDIMSEMETGEGERIENGVNIIGLSIMHKDWASYSHELTHFLKDAGFKIVCILGTGCTVQEMRDSVRAEYNIIIDPLYSQMTSELYEERFGVTPISIGECPIGFDNIEKLMMKIGKVTGIMPEHGIRMIDKSKKRAYEGITVSDRSVKGMTFSIEAPVTTTEPLRRFLVESFGMVECDDDPDYLFAPGNIAILKQHAGRCRKGIDIGFPSSGRSAFLKQPIMGLEGVMYILDGLFN